MGTRSNLRLGQRGASGGPMFKGDKDTYKQKLNEIMANLNKQIGNIEGASMKGLIDAAIYIRNKTEKTTPVTPVDLGNLRSSWFITTATQKTANDQWNKGFRNVTGEKGKYKGASADSLAATMQSEHVEAIGKAKQQLSSMNTPTRKFLMMGYSANYAGYVHEYIGNKVVWKRQSPMSGSKWFQAAVNSNTQKIFQIIAETSKVIK